MIRHIAILLKSCIINSTPLRTSYITVAAACVLPASDSIMLLVFSGFRSIFAEIKCQLDAAASCKPDT